MFFAEIHSKSSRMTRLNALMHTKMFAFLFNVASSVQFLSPHFNDWLIGNKLKNTKKVTHENPYRRETGEKPYRRCFPGHSIWKHIDLPIQEKKLRFFICILRVRVNHGTKIRAAQNHGTMSTAAHNHNTTSKVAQNIDKHTSLNMISQCTIPGSTDRRILTNKKYGTCVLKWSAWAIFSSHSVQYMWACGFSPVWVRDHVFLLKIKLIYQCTCQILPLPFCCISQSSYVCVLCCMYFDRTPCCTSWAVMRTAG